MASYAEHAQQNRLKTGCSEVQRCVLSPVPFDDALDNLYEPNAGFG